MEREFQRNMPQLSVRQLEVPIIEKQFRLYIGEQGYGKGYASKERRLSRLIHGDTKVAKQQALFMRMGKWPTDGTS